MIFFIDHFIAPGGVRLRYGFTRPAHAVAYVMILQGRGEFIERYDETARELAARNLGCVAFDFRGQGGASREVAQRNMCHVDDINCYCADTFNVVAHVKAHLGLSPSLLLSHSTGSLVGMKMLIDAPSLWQSAVMIAPFFALGGVNGQLKLVAKCLSSGFCRLGLEKQYLPGQKRSSRVQPFDPRNTLTSDSRRHQRNWDYLKVNPDLFAGGVSAGWLNACLRAQAELEKKAKELSAGQPSAVLPPISMVLAGDDRVVNNRRTRKIFGKNPSVSMTQIPAARHEILQERDLFRVQFWRAFDRHIQSHHPDWQTVQD